MTQNDRELTLLQLISQMSKRGEWSGMVYLQALSFLLESSSQAGYQFEHYWFRGGPYSSVVAETLASLRADGWVTYDSVVLPAGPAYRCTLAGEQRLISHDSSTTEHLTEVFLSRPGNQRLLLARSAYALTNQPNGALQWLEELGTTSELGAQALSVAQELITSRCRPAVAT